MDDVWMEHFLRNRFLPNKKHFRYYQFWGTDELRRNVTVLMNTLFEPSLTLSHEDVRKLSKLLYKKCHAESLLQVFLQNGAIWSMDNLSYFLADDGDAFLCPVPSYTGYFQPGATRWGVDLVSIPLEHNPVRLSSWVPCQRVDWKGSTVNGSTEKSRIQKGLPNKRVDQIKESTGIGSTK